MENNDTSVSIAAKLGNAVLLKKLLEQGYPIRSRDNRAWHPLHVAAAGGHVECIQVLLTADPASVDTMIPEGLTALYIACEPGESYTEVVKLLLRAGADPNMKGGSYWCFPLTKAVLNNLYDIVKLLLDAGSNPNKTVSMGGAPLMAAADKGYLDIAQLLVERGAKVDFQDDKGRTALHFLLCPKSDLKEDSTIIPFIDLLVNGGLDVNAQMFDGTTPLMMAVQGNKIGVVSHLLELGADLNIETDFGFLALHYAIEFCPDFSTERHDGSNSEGETTDHVLRKILDLTSRKNFNALKLMVNAGVPLDTSLRETACTAFDEADVQCLDETDFRLYCQVPTVRELGMQVDTPLGYLLSKPLNEKLVEMAKFMIVKGSNVNVDIPRCLPPLVAAVKHQRARYSHGCPGLDILEHLLNNGVDVMHKIRAKDVLPIALHISSLFNVHAFFALLVRCIPIHEIYTPRTLASLSRLYAKSAYYKVYPLWPWRVISWLNVVNAFVPQLPLDTKNTFDIQRMVEDDNLSRAWDDLDAQIGSPKKLEQLCVLTVRRVVGERRGWNRLTTFLRKLTLMKEPLPNLLMDLLTFKQMESSCLSKWPPRDVLSRYVLSAANSRNANRDDEDDPSEDVDDDEDDPSDEDDDDDDPSDEDDDDNDEDDDDGGDNEDGNCDKEDNDKKGAEEQNDDSVEEEEENKKNK